MADTLFGALRPPKRRRVMAKFEFDLCGPNHVEVKCPKCGWSTVLDGAASISDTTYKRGIPCEGPCNEVTRG